MTPSGIFGVCARATISCAIFALVGSFHRNDVIKCHRDWKCPWGGVLLSFSSPFTCYLPLSRHFIFIITLFISIITFLTKVCHHHHHLSRTSMFYYHFLALSLVIFPPGCFRICCVVLQVVYHVLTVGVLNKSEIVHLKISIYKICFQFIFLHF